MAEEVELSGTVKKMSPSGKGFLLNEYENWWNFGKGYDGPRPFAPNAAITVTYEESVRPDGTSSFFVLSAWPTTGQAGPVPPQVTPAGPKPTAGPTPTNGPVPAKPASYEGYQAAATGPVPTPPNRENAILFQVCLKAAVEWVLRRHRHGDPNRTEGQVLFVADVFYRDALKVLSDEPEESQDGDPGPGEPA
jgi:hypothetical protein